MNSLLTLSSDSNDSDYNPDEEMTLTESPSEDGQSETLTEDELNTVDSPKNNSDFMTGTLSLSTPENCSNTSCKKRKLPEYTKETLLDTPIFQSSSGNQSGTPTSDVPDTLQNEGATNNIKKTRVEKEQVVWFHGNTTLNASTIRNMSEKRKGKLPIHIPIHSYPEETYHSPFSEQKHL